MARLGTGARSMRIPLRHSSTWAPEDYGLCDGASPSALGGRAISALLQDRCRSCGFGRSVQRSDGLALEPPAGCLQSGLLTTCQSVGSLPWRGSKEAVHTPMHRLFGQATPGPATTLRPQARTRVQSPDQAPQESSTETLDTKRLRYPRLANHGSSSAGWTRLGSLGRQQSCRGHPLRQARIRGLATLPLAAISERPRHYL